MGRRPGGAGALSVPRYDRAVKADDRTWLTLGEASRILGVDPDTLRRWADTGKVEVFTTPGGHRRFPRAAIEHMLPRPRARRSLLTALGEPPDRVAAELRRSE